MNAFSVNTNSVI